VLNVGTPELLLVMLVALLVLGPQKLPEVARQIGKAMAEVRKLTSGFQAEMRDALQEPLRNDEPPGYDAPTSDDLPGEERLIDGDPTAG
jgi:Tat protein translocase TatB subunit